MEVGCGKCVTAIDITNKGTVYIERARIYVRKCSSTKTDYANVQVVLKEIKCAMSAEREIII